VLKWAMNSTLRWKLTLVVRPKGEVEQITQVDEILDNLFRERESVYRALAKGAK